jgi:hypothetical protein
MHSSSLPSKNTSQNEIDFIRTVVKKRNFQAAYDLLSKKTILNAKELSSKQRNEER